MSDLYYRTDLEMVGDKAKFAVNLDSLEVHVLTDGSYKKSDAFAINEEGDIVSVDARVEPEGVQALARTVIAPPVATPSNKVNLRNDSFY